MVLFEEFRINIDFSRGLFLFSGRLHLESIDRSEEFLTDIVFTDLAEYSKFIGNG